MNVFVTEILQQEIEIESDDAIKALEIAEAQYNNGDIVLDYSNCVDVGFSNCGITRNEMQILNEITDFCDQECCSNNQCAESACVLFRIEKVIIE